MERDKYNKLINKNTLSCWIIISIVLMLAYILELIKGTRSILYTVLFSLVIIIPITITYLFYKKTDGKNLNMKYFFVIGYMMFYTFCLFTAKTNLVYTYIFPMASVLIVYCDSKLIFQMFTYIIIVNLIKVGIQIIPATDYFLENSATNPVMIYEIQIVCLILTGIFLSKSCKVIKKRDEILDILSDDVYRDPLTNSYNKKFIENKILPEFSTWLDNTVCLSFIDIDDFKQFNTLYGHRFGDEVLIMICRTIKNYIKNLANTHLIRVGGDEFIIISKDLNKKDFYTMMKQILKTISHTKLIFGKKKVNVKITMGMADNINDLCNNFNDLYNLADTRNGYAKENGKNYIEDKKN